MSISPTPKLIGRKDGAVAQLIFNQAEKRNAVSFEMWEAIPSILKSFEADPEVRVLVVTGAGDKAFVSGADISEFGDLRASPEQNAHYDRVGEVATQSIQDFSKPTIARINGDCIGGGVAVALRCDIRIASARSRFGVPAAKLGVGYAPSGVRCLIDIVGPSFAREILFTGRLFSADEALAMGLVNRVTDDVGLDSQVHDYCCRVAENAPLTIRTAKRTIDALLRGDTSPDELAALARACFESEDYAEGWSAFMQKRKPVFRGK